MPHEMCADATDRIPAAKRMRRQMMLETTRKSIRIYAAENLFVNFSCRHCPINSNFRDILSQAIASNRWESEIAQSVSVLANFRLLALI